LTSPRLLESKKLEKAGPEPVLGVIFLLRWGVQSIAGLAAYAYPWR
jgi:hypothetical protein